MDAASWPIVIASAIAIFMIIVWPIPYCRGDVPADECDYEDIDFDELEEEV